MRISGTLCLLLISASLPAQVGRVRVINAGVPGENSSELRARFAAEVARWHPRFVVLFTGMNDAANEKKFVAPDTFRENITAMSGEARRDGVGTVVVNVHHVDQKRVLARHPPSSYGDRPPNRRIDELDSILEALAAERLLTLVDFRKRLADEGGADERLSPDGVHLNAVGYRLLAEAVRVSLGKRVAAGDTVLCVGDSLTFGTGVRPPGAGLASPEGVAYPTYPERLGELLNGEPGSGLRL